MGNGLLFQALIYLSAAVLFVPIAKKLGLGSVLGYLIAGMIIGPSVLNLVGDGSEDVMHVAEFGVVIMLFLIGLELEPETLWKLRLPILGMGGLQVLVSATLIALIVVLMGYSPRDGLVLGLILALSSTAIVLQSLDEKGWTKSAGGAKRFFGALVSGYSGNTDIGLAAAAGQQSDSRTGGWRRRLGNGIEQWMESGDRWGGCGIGGIHWAICGWTVNAYGHPDRNARIGDRYIAAAPGRHSFSHGAGGTQSCPRRVYGRCCTGQQRIQTPAGE